MNPLPLRWKLFRIMCIMQMIMIVYPLASYAVSIFRGNSVLLSLVHVGCYLLVLLFLFQGMTLLNDNFPNTPFTPLQKRRYNRLFLVNFVLIAFLFSKVVSQWWIISLIFHLDYPFSSLPLLLFVNIAIVLLTFVFHLLFLYGMYRLRVLIQTNTVETWVQQFDQETP